MNIPGALLLFVSLAVIAQPQTPPQNSPEPPDLAIIKFSWSKERINWEGDPFGGPVENFDDMRVRTRNDRRLEVNKGSVEEERIRREVKADAANQELLRQKRTPARYVFMYKLSVKNNSAKAIKAIDWDYVFFDADTQTERGRRQFASEEKIEAGKNKQLVFTIHAPPTQTISASALNDKERQNLGERIIIMRVLYADGTIWQRPQP